MTFKSSNGIRSLSLDLIQDPPGSILEVLWMLKTRYLIETAFKYDAKDNVLVTYQIVIGEVGN
jgi:hypothetical protein